MTGPKTAGDDIHDGGLPARDNGAPSTAWSAFDGLITDRARGVIDAYLETRDRVDWGRSIKSMTAHTTHEYGGRFLLELLQNAYDAHPRERQDGRISIRLDETEDEHGVLYVANGGVGFTESNFRAICNLGLSDKPVGEGIGNKGVGFKSVLQICEAPEIYSCDPAEVSREGFSFRFARPEDIPRLVGGDETKAAQIIKDVSLHTVPIPLRPSDGYASVLREQGFSTVVRLPLRSGTALNEARKRLEELAGSTVPVLLFLHRISLLTIEHMQDDTSHVKELRREASDLKCDGAEAQRVALTEGGEFFVFSRDVDPDDLHAAITNAVAAELLDSRWLEWQAPASISVAVPVSHEIAEFRSYTYLPMGPKALAPFAGHLNAPFYTNLARIDVDFSHPLNAMLLSASAALALKAAETLAAGTETGWACAVVDLISWKADAISHLSAAARFDGVPLGDRKLIPTGQRTKRLTSMAEGWQWPLPEADILTVDLACQTTEMSPIWQGLGDARLDRLGETMASLGHHIDPSTETLADWVEKMAARCLRDDLPLNGWDRLYNDIACMFEGDAAALTGRKLLLSNESELRPCSGPRSTKGLEGRVTPFFPPVRQRTEDEYEVDTASDLGLPTDVKKRIFYLHSGLTWYDDNREQTRARAFLQEHRLVRRFDARSLLEQLRSILTTSHGRRLHRESLRFVYNVSNDRLPARVALNELGLRVPNRDGVWIPAEAALFSESWPGTHGEDLNLLASATNEIDAELAALRRRMIAPPRNLFQKTDSVESWVDFLRKLGVQEGLPVLSTPDKRKLRGRDISRSNLYKLAGLPADIATAWEPILKHQYQANFPDTEYIAKLPVYWLPGQATAHLLPHRRRVAYARLLIAGLARWQDEHFATVWERNRTGNKDQQLIPTPLATFLRSAEWLPIDDPGAQQNRFDEAANSWYFPTGSSDTPRFSPLVASVLRTAINDNPSILRRLKDAGVGMWTDPQHSMRLIANLGEQLAAGRLDLSRQSQFQEAYLAAWTQAATLPWPEKYEIRYLVAETAGHLRALATEELQNQPPLTIADKSDDPFSLRLIREFDQPIIQLSVGAATIAGRLASRFDDRIALLADMKFSPVLDNEVFIPDAGETVLVDRVPWLRKAFAVVLDHRWRNPTPLSNRVFQKAIDELNHVRIARAATISVRAAGQDRLLPKRMHGILPVPDDRYPTLAIQGYPVQFDWSLLEALPEALLQLVGHRSLATEFALIIHKFRSNHVDFGSGPTLVELAEVCDVEVQAVEQTLLRIETALLPLLARLYPVVCFWTGAELAQPLSPQTGGISNEENLVAALDEIADRLPVSSVELVAAARTASSIDELRKTLGIKLGDLNNVLTQIGPHYTAIDYAEQHVEDFDWYVRTNWIKISDRLRWALMSDFRAGHPIARWAEIRDPKSFTADPAWNLSTDHLSDDNLQERVEHELTSMLGKAAPTSGSVLPPMESTRQSNVRLTESGHATMGRIVRAWCAKNSIEADHVWSEMSDSRSFVRLLDFAGALDFELLGSREVLGWLQACSVWPSGMPLTTDTAEAGLKAEDLERAESEESRVQQEHQKARQAVAVNGKPVHVGNGYGDLRDKLEASLDSNSGILDTAVRFSKLEELNSSLPRRSRTSRVPASAGGSPPRASQTQLTAIGFAGELVAYKWLAKRYKEQFSDDCWVSTNRTALLAGPAGDDGCGYDFLIPSRGGGFMYEVKATTGDAGEFQLGESEVRQAQLNARNDRWRLIIVTQVLNDDRQLLMLHNPFSPRSRGQYVFAGEGLRIRYAPVRS